MPRKSKSKIAPRGEGEIPAPKVETPKNIETTKVVASKMETPRVEAPRVKYVIEPITSEEYARFGNPSKSEVRKVAEEIVAKALESNTPLKITFNNLKVRQIIPVLAQIARELKNEKSITIDFKASMKDNVIVIKKVSGQ